MSFYVEFFKEIRRKHGLSVIQLAQTLGVSRQHMHKIESGTYRPSQKTIDLACSIFNVEIKMTISYK